MSDLSDLSSSELDDKRTITIDKLQIKQYLGVFAIVFFVVGLISFIAYDTITSQKIRKQQKLEFINKMESKGWMYSCVGGNKMVFIKDDDHEERPFTVKECCGGLK